VRVAVSPGVLSMDSLAAAVAAAAELGLDADFELFPHGTYCDLANECQARYLRARLDDIGLRVYTVHAPFGDDVDLSRAEAAIAAKTLAAVREAVRYAAVAGARVVVVHPGHGCRPAEEAERLACTRDALAPLTREASEGGLALAVENMPPGYVGSRFAELASLMDAGPPDALGICFDTGHAALHSPAERPTPVAGRILAVHAHDNLGDKDAHLCPGLGVVRWREVRADLEAGGYRRPITLECAPTEGWSVTRMIDTFYAETGYAPGDDLAGPPGGAPRGEAGGDGVG
jgi:sugar phosphate isomerase/epimerase